MKSNTTKYLKYAFGEIILVVIGILIALQINNWNETFKLQKEEVKLLEQLQQDLINNKAEILDLERRLNVNKKGVDSLLRRLKIQKNDPDLPFYVTMMHRKSYFNNANSGYNLYLNNSSLNISNDTIRNSILELYEKDFPDIISRQLLIHQKIDNNLYPLTNSLFKVKPMTLKFRDLDVTESDFYEPIDFDLLVENNLYANTLIQLKRSFEEHLILNNKTQQKIESVLQDLEA